MVCVFLLFVCYLGGQYLAGDIKPIRILSSTGGSAHFLYAAYDT